MIPKNAVSYFMALVVSVSGLIWGCAGKDQQEDLSSPKSSTSPALPAFSGAAAFRHLEIQVGFGPRVPGTAGHAQTLDYIRTVLKSRVDSTIIQNFTRTSQGVRLDLTNVIGLVRGSRSGAKRILLGAHWDTRPRADRDPNRDNWSKPIPGANDGASGVAVLLQMAHILSENRPDLDVILAFLDGEDYGNIKGFPFSLGARYYADTMEAQALRPDWVVVLDMIGDANLNIKQESNSTPWLREIIWQIAGQMGAGGFVDGSYAVIDDHLPFLEQGIPAVDLIDFEFPPWHTLQDTVDKCSPESLRQVGAVIVALLYGGWL